MVFSKFTQPKWQHQDPNVRSVAIEDLNDLTVLNQIAQQDEEASIRQTAVAKIEDLSLLKTIARQDEDDKVRVAAEQRFREVLCGKNQPPVPLAERLARLNQMIQ